MDEGTVFKPNDRYARKRSLGFTTPLLRANLMKRLMIYKDYGRNALLLTVLSYNIGAGRLLGYGKYPKSQLRRKTESGDRNSYLEFVSFSDIKVKSSEVSSNDKKWSLPCFIYPNYQIRLLKVLSAF